MSPMEKKTLEYYQALPYSHRAEGVHEDGASPYWIAWIDELPGCKTDGSTYAEAMANLDAAFDDYIEAMLEFDSHIPTPKEIHGTPRVSEVAADEIVQILVIEGDSTAEASLQQWVQDAEGTTTRMVAATHR